MKLESKRMFISDLPETATEEEIQKKFSKFGNVTGIEIKERKTLGVRNQSYLFAFVNFDATHESLQKCLEEFSNKQWLGSYVNIQLAKESFLEKLKREREQNGTQVESSEPKVISIAEQIAKSGSKKDFLLNDESTISLKRKKDAEEGANFSIERPNKKKSRPLVVNGTNCMEDDQNPDENVENLNENGAILEEPADYSEIVVKNNKSEVKDGKKIIIKSVGNAPVQISGPTKRKSKDPYREKADQKRINSMMAMKKGHQQKNNLIRKALQNFDSAKKNKIFFDDNDDENVVENSERPTLFEDGDVEEEESYDISHKKQFDGKKGEKLFQLQSRYNSDKRFHLDERFAESDHGDEQEGNEDNGAEDDLAQEKRKELEILGEILDQTFDVKHKRQNKEMLRFDPSQPDHLKYELKAQTENKTRGNKKERKIVEEEKVPEVSKETFYTVSADIKESLKEDQPFSLLSMLGRSNEDDAKIADEPEKETHTNEKPAKTGKRFQYDSSTDDDEDKNSKEIPKNVTSIEKPASERNIIDLGPQRLWTESFFFKVDDYRFQEGLDFIKRAEKKESEEDFKDVRHCLKKIVKAKLKSNEKRHEQFRKKVTNKRKMGKKQKQR